MAGVSVPHRKGASTGCRNYRVRLQAVPICEKAGIYGPAAPLLKLHSDLARRGCMAHEEPQAGRGQAQGMLWQSGLACDQLTLGVASSGRLTVLQSSQL
ncbi:hypothetical protein NDU88_000414 [Pleurodeles waltl]|uniref:Uncharacterized protein n=1 Tax=Pleurodeles waltl TaxID=8319 RepID=A0AAV7TFF1_PLEWA|nr:hypothetical protein NDU88_000414 [Pleurodeles waltl]